MMFEFCKAAPESQGVPSEAISAFIKSLSELDAIHSVMLVRHDKLIAETWWKPFKKEYKHELFSCSKSFVSSAFGIARQEGLVSLEDRLVSFFPDKITEKVSERMKKVTLRNLLTMASGHDCCPLANGSIARNHDWVKGFLESELVFEPGERFVYNSAATYMISSVLRRVTGKNVLDYLNEKVFPHIGVYPEKWDCCPDGTNIGGWGFWLKTEDLLRFGRLLLNKGDWDGKQLIPADYIEEATSFQIDNSMNSSPDWKLGYGYQFWRTSFNSFRGDGACGQYVLVMPEYDLYMAVTSGVGNMQQILTFFWVKVVPALQQDALPEQQRAYEELQNILSSREHCAISGDLFFSKADTEYVIEDNGFGLKKFRVHFDNRGCELTFVWSDENIETMRADYGKHTNNFLQLDEDAKRILEASAAWLSENELDIQVYAVETPYRDHYILRFDADKIEIERKSNFLFLHKEMPLLHGIAVGN